MNAAGLSALGWLVRDTFLQARASRISWLMLAVTAACAAACLTVTVADGSALGGPGPAPVLSRAERGEAALAAADLVASGASQARGGWPEPVGLVSPRYRAVQQVLGRHAAGGWSRVHVAFGAGHLDVPGGRAEAVRAVQVQLAGWVADAFGLLLALLWTAGFLPSFLDAAAVTVLLAKPVPRWGLLAGKCLGVLAFVACQALAFLACTWLALGLRTGVWELNYFLCLPLLLLHFGIFFSFSAMLAVATRSPAASVFGTVLFWLVCWAVNFGRHAVRSSAALEAFGAGAGRGVELGYWLLPKPLDLHVILLDLLQADHLFSRVIDAPALAARGAWSPGLSVLASVLCAAALLAVAAYDFLTAEY
jgi:hypothetical protein